MFNVHRTVSNMPYNQLHTWPSIYVTLPDVHRDQGEIQLEIAHVLSMDILVTPRCWINEQRALHDIIPASDCYNFLVPFSIYTDQIFLVRRAPALCNIPKRPRIISPSSQ